MRSHSRLTATLSSHYTHQPFEIIIMIVRWTCVYYKIRTIRLLTGAYMYMYMYLVDATWTNLRAASNVQHDDLSISLYDNAPNMLPLRRWIWLQIPTHTLLLNEVQSRHSIMHALRNFAAERVNIVYATSLIASRKLSQAQLLRWPRCGSCVGCKVHTSCGFPGFAAVASRMASQMLLWIPL